MNISEKDKETYTPPKGDYGYGFSLGETGEPNPDDCSEEFLIGYKEGYRQFILFGLAE